MIIILKALMFFLSILIVMPVLFFFLLISFGSMFELTIDRNSWIARTNIKWLRDFFHKFIV